MAKGNKKQQTKSASVRAAGCCARTRHEPREEDRVVVAARHDLHRADRDEQLHVARRQDAADLRPVRHLQGVLPACPGSDRAGRMGMGHPDAGRQDPPQPGRLADPGVPRVGGASPRFCRSRRLPRSSASTVASRACCPSSTTRSSTSSSCSSPTGRRASERSPRRSSGLGSIVTGYGVLQSVGVDPVKWGQLPFEAQAGLRDLRQPRSARRVPDVLAADHARPRALRGQAVDANRLLARFRRERVVLDRGVHPRCMDRRARQHPARHLHRISPPRAVLQGRLDPGGGNRRAGGGHHRREPQEPQRGHELRRALQVDRRLPGWERQDPNADLAGGHRRGSGSPDLRVSGRIRSGSSSPSTSRSSTSRMRATARSPTTSTTTRFSSRRVSASSAS